MPTYRTEVGPEGNPVVKCVLHAHGMWGDLTEVQQAAWNRATLAINALCDLYDESS